MFSSAAWVTTGVSAYLLWLRSFGNWWYMQIKIFDEQHLVTLLIVNQFINELFCQQHTKATWPQSLHFTNRHVAEQILGRATNGCVAKLFERGTLAGILNAAGYRATRTDE